MRIFDPLPAGHPIIGRTCSICGVPFVEGDRTTLVPLLLNTGSLNTIGAPCHPKCVEREES